ncbi:MAG: efflux RND transporter periplasmic adaptor subunit [Steroidobacteraceae bacterium]
MTTENYQPGGPVSALLRLRGPKLWIPCAAIVVAAAALWWWLGRTPPLHYITARITRGDIQRSVTMTGALNPVVTAQVGSYVSGNIKSWSCDYNTPVKVGQRCAVIDPLPFQVVVDQDQADLGTVVAQLAKDRAALANAELVYEHDTKLIDQGIVSQETLDTDKSTRDQDRAQVNLDIASIAEKKAVLHAAQVNLAYTNIVSPVDGMVITRYIDVGQTVVSSLQSSTLFLIGKDMRKMQVDTNVSEADVGDVAAGQKATFTVQAFPNRTFVGTVRQIREGPITVQNVVTYDVVVDVPNDDLKLMPGMTADAHIITAERTDVLRVPLPAVRFNPEGFAHEEGGEHAHRGGAAAPGSGAAAVGQGAVPGTAGGSSGPAGEGAPGAGGERPRWAAGGGAGVSGHGGPGGAHGHARAGRGAPRARIWLLRDGKLVPVEVHTGLDDGTLIEVIGDDIKEGDVVVVNAVRPGEPKPEGGERPPGSNPNQRPGGGGNFRL